MKYLILLCFTAALHAFASEEESGGARIGPGKGVVSYSREAGFSLSPEAVKRMDIQTAPLDLTKCELKRAQVLTALDQRLIFIRRNQKYKGVPHSCVGLTANDEVVVAGAEFLQVIDMDLRSGEPEGNEVRLDQ